MDDFLEKGMIRNSKRFSAVFRRIYDKYDREFEKGEYGAQELTNEDLLHNEDEVKESEISFQYKKDPRSMVRCQSTCDFLLGLSADSEQEEEEEDHILTYLLHEKVEQVKKEICWEEEEQKEKERKALTKRKSHSSSSSSSEEEEESMGHCRKRRRGRGRKRREKGKRAKNEKSEVFGDDEEETFQDGSETLWETEYQSDSDRSCVNSDPEKGGCVTPTRGVYRQEAHTTPRLAKRAKQRSSFIKRTCLQELQKMRVEVGKEEVVGLGEVGIIQNDAELFSGYDSDFEHDGGRGLGAESGPERQQEDISPTNQTTHHSNIHSTNHFTYHSNDHFTDHSTDHLTDHSNTQQEHSKRCSSPPDILTSPPPTFVKNGFKKRLSKGTLKCDMKEKPIMGESVSAGRRCDGEEEKGEEGGVTCEGVCRNCSYGVELPTNHNPLTISPNSIIRRSCDSHVTSYGGHVTSHDCCVTSYDGHVTQPVVVHNTNVPYIYCNHNPSFMTSPHNIHCSLCAPSYPCCTCLHSSPLTHYHTSHPSPLHPSPLAHTNAPFLHMQPHSNGCAQPAATFGNLQMFNSFKNNPNTKNPQSLIAAIPLPSSTNILNSEPSDTPNGIINDVISSPASKPYT